MGFLDRLTASRSANIKECRSLTSMDQLAEINDISEETTVVIFKHSTSCGISANAKNRLESSWGEDQKHYIFYYLDLLQYRPISNRIAELYNVRHESPQIIVVKNRRAVYNSSHHSIRLHEIEKHT